MRLHLFPLSCAFIFLSCSPSISPPVQRAPIVLKDLAVTVREGRKEFFLSDKTGGFLLGSVGKSSAPGDVHWSVDGIDIVRGITLQIGGRPLDGASLDSAVIAPDMIAQAVTGGGVETLTIVDGGDGEGDAHVLLVRVRGQEPADVVFRIATGADFSVQDSGASATWLGHSSVYGLSLTSEPEGRWDGSDLTVHAARDVRFVLLYAPRSERMGHQELVARVDSLAARRSSRMDKLLNDSYLATNDTILNRAIGWSKLALDALIVERADTFSVAGLPWDGSIDGRANAQSIAGIGLATGDYRKTASILRCLARWQDTRVSSSTYGRIADRVENGVPRYRGVDVAPWYAREIYEHITYANDTALVRATFPVVRRSIDGTERYHLDTNNFVTHGEGETWMGAARRGNRACEVQLLWYFQQMIGSYMALYLGDTTAADRWSKGAERTATHFNAAFVDTAHSIVYDALTARGQPVTSLRPNTLFCLELIGPELVRQSMIKRVFNALVVREGVRTLAPADPAYAANGTGTDAYNGPVWPWLAGQLAYALSRYDHQDLAFEVTRHEAEVIAAGPMPGSLPAVWRDVPSPGAHGGQAVSVTALAEFVRALYQDYLGIRVDGPSDVLTLQPKLPEALRDIDFTVTIGTHRVDGGYHRDKDRARITIYAPDITKEMKLNFFWMMPGGDAWRGSTMIPPRTHVTVVIGEDDALVYQEDRRGTLASSRKLRRFSLRDELTGLTFAGRAAAVTR